jgi:hypothetical protein
MNAFVAEMFTIPLQNSEGFFLVVEFVNCCETADVVESCTVLIVDSYSNCESLDNF